MLSDLLMSMLLGSGPDALFQGEHLSDTGLETAVISYARTGDCNRARGHWHTLRARQGEAAPLLDEVLACMSDRARSGIPDETHDGDPLEAKADAVWAGAVSKTADQFQLASLISQSAERSTGIVCDFEPDICFMEIKLARDEGHTRDIREHLEDTCHKYIEEYERLYVRNERF